MECIKSVLAREILDSRGFPTVEVDVELVIDRLIADISMRGIKGDRS